MRLIDADAFKGKLIRELNKSGKYTSYECGLDDAVTYLDEQPTIEAEPVKHGRWINIFHAKIDTTGDCSACGEEAVWRTRKKPYAICPNCGAKMRGNTDE